jgi:hypothetical protein
VNFFGIADFVVICILIILKKCQGIARGAAVIKIESDDTCSLSLKN